VTQLTEEEAETLAAMKTERLKDDTDASKGFVISFDDEQPKKPKPALKVRRPSKKFSSSSDMHMNSDGSSSSRKENVPPELMICIVSSTAHIFCWTFLSNQNYTKKNLFLGFSEKNSSINIHERGDLCLFEVFFLQF
jgi:hypothetical protein